ncbi:MAG: hypothetical protein FP831_12200 [Anaerolineae bacterium]|nr:hypothetical protein [Anaerolineae bacterium]
MTTCYRCGASLSDNAITCSSCGAVQAPKQNTEITPPLPPVMQKSENSPKSNVGVPTAVYLIIMAIASISYFVIAIFLGIRFTIRELALIGFPNIVNVGVCVYLAIMMLMRKKNSPIFFVIWAGVFLLNQVTNILMFFSYRHIFITGGPLYLWILFNLIIVIFLTILLIKNRKSFSH